VPILLKLNPMYHLINLFRAPIYGGYIPSITEIAISAGIALVTLVIGWWFFSKRADEFAYRV
jgi:ABC-type polysaccharide/polyol phosphate export permease